MKKWLMITLLGLALNAHLTYAKDEHEDHDGDPDDKHHGKHDPAGGAAPEFDFLLSGGALALVSGGLLVIRSRKRK